MEQSFISFFRYQCRSWPGICTFPYFIHVIYRYISHHFYTFQKIGSKISISQFPSFLSLTMDFLLFRTSLFYLQIHICFVDITFFPIFQTALDSLSNIPKLKSFTLAEIMVLSIPLLSTYCFSEAQSYNPRIRLNIWVSFSIENYYSTNTLITTPIKQYQQSSA